jgi:hypothetical protein
VSWIGGEKLLAYRQSGLLPVNDAAHNLREIVKEMLLLEDHLFHPEKRCGSCIIKHLLKIEALFEEAVSMDETGEHAEITAGAAEEIRALIAAINDSAVSPTETGQIIRAARRALQDAIA